MKVTLDSKCLKPVVSALKRLADKNSVSILSYARMDVDESGNVTIQATDYDVRFTARFTALDVSEAGTCLVPVLSLQKAVSHWAGDTIRIESVDQETLTLKDGKYSLAVSPLAVADFPNWAAELPDDGTYLTLKTHTSTLKDILEMILPTISRDRQPLRGAELAFTLVDKVPVFQLAATNGHRLIVVQRRTETCPDWRKMISLRFLEEVAAFCVKNPTLDAELLLGTDSISFRCSVCTLFSNLMDQEFVDWAALADTKDDDPEIQFDREDAIKTLSTLAKMGADNLTLSVKDPVGKFSGEANYTTLTGEMACTGSEMAFDVSVSSALAIFRAIRGERISARRCSKVIFIQKAEEASLYRNVDVEFAILPRGDLA